MFEQLGYGKRNVSMRTVVSSLLSVFLLGACLGMLLMGFALRGRLNWVGLIGTTVVSFVTWRLLLQPLIGELRKALPHPGNHHAH